MRKATACLIALLLATAGTLAAQESEFLLEVPVTADLKEPYAIGIHSGARDVYGPVDLDNDGREEVLVSDYTGGGRVHVVENAGPDVWEWVYSTPWLDSTATTDNIRAVAGGDLDGDELGEIYFFGGRGYSEDTGLPIGLYGFEFNGTDFGTAPATIYQFADHLPDRWRMEDIVIKDVDDDGTPELMFANNGSGNEHDNWYILSVTGDIGGGFEVWVEEARLSSRGSEDFDSVDRGGGSPYYIDAGDFNGDGVSDLLLHSWNAYNLHVGQATAADTYEFPEGQDAWIHASNTGDDVSFFGGTVVDIDQDGNDEVALPILCWSGGSPSPICGSVSIVDYAAGESTMQITQENVAFALLEGVSQLGIAAGDLDGDGLMELFGSGPGYSGESRSMGNLPTFIKVAEYTGAGSVTDRSSYEILDIKYFEPFDTTEAFDEVRGQDTTFFETGDQGPEFVSKMAYLGDPDGDGANELAVAFQGVDDSTFVIEESVDPNTNLPVRTVVERNARENRVFMRVLSGIDQAVGIVDERIVMPHDYLLSDNYPNPFNPSTSFSYTLPLDKTVSVKIYDVNGRVVKTLVNNEFRTAGTHEVTWDGTNDAGQSVASGTYLYSLEWGQFRQTKNMVLVK